MRSILIAGLMIAVWCAQAHAYPGWEEAGQKENPQVPAPMDANFALQGFREHASRIQTDEIERLSTLSNGRVKPLYSLARESLLFISGSYSKWGLTPPQIYLGLASSKTSLDLEFINVRSPELRERLGYSKKQRYFSLRQLEQSRLMNLARVASQKEQEDAKSLTSSEKDILEAANQLWLLQQVISGEHFVRSIDIAGMTKTEGAESEAIQAAAQDYLKSLAIGQAAPVAALIEQVRTQPMPELFKPQLATTELEILYTKCRPFLFVAILYLLLGAAVLWPRLRRSLSTRAVVAAFALPALLQVVGFAARVYITGFAPVTNMYGTMLWVSFGVGVFTLLLFALYRKHVLAGMLWISSGLLLLLTENIPLILSPDMDPIVAVLRSNFWLTIHVLTITISYAAFTITMVIGNVALVKSIFAREIRQFCAEYAHPTYRMIQLGVFLLTVGIILGGIWADYSWGRFWGWDPKETWALIADVGYLAILHARYAGWLGPFGMLAASPIAYLLVVMAWYGVNFILASGLHSYGFSSGGALAVAVFVGLQSLLLIAALIQHQRRRVAAATGGR